jgi:hypothetical protein
MYNNMETYTFYKIQCIDETVTETYIGSTVEVKNRTNCHKSNCCNPKSKDYNLKVYTYIRENGDWTNFNMNVIETGEYESKTYARIRETELMEIYNSKLNSRRAYRTDEQLKEQKKAYDKKYSQKNKNKNKEKIKKQKQKYYQDNKSKYQKLYQDNKAKLSEKFECECGGKYTYKKKSQHTKSIKHQLYLQTINLI